LIVVLWSEGENLILDLFDWRRAAGGVQSVQTTAEVPDLFQPRGNRLPNQISRPLGLWTVASEVTIESQDRGSARANGDILRVERTARGGGDQPQQQRRHRRHQPDAESYDILRLLTEMRSRQPAPDEGCDERGGERADECDKSENNRVHNESSHCRSNTAFDSELAVKLSNRSVKRSRPLASRAMNATNISASGLMGCPQLTPSSRR